MEIADNSLCCTIPTDFGGLTELRIFDLSGNTQLSGPIPSEFGTLGNLERLNVARTGLSGDCPSEIGLLPNLEEVYIEGTAITANFDTLLCVNGGQYEFLGANCLEGASQVACACCTTCCDANGGNCVVN
jgi:hypothetical protein